MQPLEQPVFLVGTTRSGTTLLSLMLGSHAQIGFVGEFEWAFDFRFDGKTLDDMYEHLEIDRHFRWHKLKIDRSLGYEALIRSFLQQMHQSNAPNKPVVGTQVHRHYADLLQVWPNARFIHIVRDGRDVAASWIKFGWNGNTWSSAREWRTLVQEWAELRPKIDPARRFEIRFEDLINDSETSLRAICSFLGLEYDPAMLRYHENTTYEPVDPKQAGKWRKSLSERDIRVFEAGATEALLANGYALSGLPPLADGALLSPVLYLDDSLRKHRVRIGSYGAPLWLAEQVTRRLRLGRLHDRVQLQINDIVNRNLK